MKIYWKFDNANTYLYGTSIEQRNTDVYFSNQRMPSSFVIHSWTSRTNYQADRISPQLPLLKKNHTYSLRWQITSIPEKSYYFEIIFFDRFGHEIQHEILRETKEFVYPENAYSYQIALMNAGNTELHFSYLEIEEIEND